MCKCLVSVGDCLVDWFSRHFEVELDDSVAEKLSEGEEPWQRDSVKVGGLPFTGGYIKPYY